MKQFLAGGVALFLVAASSACGSDGSADDTSATTSSLLTQTQQATPPGGQQAPTIDVASLGFNMGDGGSAVRVVEMSDYGCGYCRQFHEETFPTLLAEFIEEGKVEWKFLPFINGMFDNSLVATEAAECALEQGPEFFRAVNDRIWADQREWKPSAEPEPIVRAIALEAGVDAARFDSCLEEDRRLDRIAAATSLASQLGVRGTPTFFVVGYPPLQGALPAETFTEILNAVYADATGNGG